MKKTLLLTCAAVALAGCDGKPGISGMQATAQGVYYRNPFGKLFRVEGEKLLPVSEAAKDAQRTIQLGSMIPATDTGTEFPANVSGSLRLDGDVQRIKLSVSLIPAGKKSPTADDQERFANSLAGGYGGIRALTLNFHDADGYVAMPTRRIDIPEEGWMRNVDDAGKVTGYEYNIRDDIEPKGAKSITSVLVGWSSTRPTTAPLPPTPAAAPIPPADPFGTPNPGGEPGASDQ